MPTLRTKYVTIGAGIYICRRGDAVHIVVTTDDKSPDMGKIGVEDGFGGSEQSLAKANWLNEQEVSVEGFRDSIATVAPDYGGVLVNVGTEEKPLLLTQQQAAIHGDIVASAAEALVQTAAETAAPVKP
jgi:hypothetical protein